MWYYYITFRYNALAEVTMYQQKIGYSDEYDDNADEM
jgi:hypothetical protein